MYLKIWLWPYFLRLERNEFFLCLNVKVGPLKIEIQRLETISETKFLFTFISFSLFGKVTGFNFR